MNLPPRIYGFAILLQRAVFLGFASGLLPNSIGSRIYHRLSSGPCIAKHESAHYPIKWKSATSYIMSRRYRSGPGLWPGDRLSYGSATLIRADTSAPPGLERFSSIFILRRKFQQFGLAEIHNSTRNSVRTNVHGMPRSTGIFWYT